MQVSEEATALIQRGDWSRALKLLKKHVKQSPADVLAVQTYAQLLFEDGDPEKAFKLLDGARGQVELSESWSICMVTGRLRERLEADGPYVRRKRGEITTAPPQKGYDELAWRAAQRVAAITAYEEAAQRAPERAEPLYLLSRALIRDQRLAPAIPVLHRLLSLQPGDAELRFLLAHALVGTGQSQTALPILERLAKDRPTDETVLQAYKKALEEVGRSGESTKIVRRMDAIGIFPPYVVPPDDEGAIDLVKNALTKRDLAAASLAARATLVYSGATRVAVVTALLHHHLAHEADARLLDDLIEQDQINIVWRLAHEATAGCVRKQALWRLTDLRADGILETLLRSLPYDTTDEPLDVAGCLAALGDGRAVGPLAEVARGSAGLGADYRRRATLALGRFSSREAVAHLNGLVRDPDVGPWAAAARYRQSNDTRFLALVEEAAKSDETLRAFMEAAAEETVGLA